jgi:hypothetical protein
LYFGLLMVVAFIFRMLANGNRLQWWNSMSINRGGLGLFDAILFIVVLALVFIGWRYFDYFEMDVFPIAIITALTAVVGLFRSPPWRYIYIFQRDSHGELLPPMLNVVSELSQGDAAIWATALQRLQDENPGFDVGVQTPGQELYVPADVRPAPVPPPAPPQATGVTPSSSTPTP